MIMVPVAGKSTVFLGWGSYDQYSINALVVMHRNYWYKVRGLKDTVPRLGICVINLHPKKQAEIPTDRDGVINRNSDITFSDRTDREEGMLLLTSDYVDLIRALIKVAEEHSVKEDIINKLLNQKTKFHGELIKLQATVTY